MARSKLHPEPAKTLRLLSNLDSAIDEAKLVRQLVNLSDNLHKIQAMPNQSGRIEFLRKEISTLEDRLANLRKRANR